MNKSINKTAQAGFTLIELIVVIVILGILAATALPKFADMSGDARTAAVQGVKGSVSSAAALAHAQALVKGQTGATGSVTMEGATISLVYGYPAATAITSAANVDGVTSVNNAGTSVASYAGPAVSTTELAFLPSGVAVTDTKAGTCYVKYTEATSATAPAVVAAVTTGC